MHGPVLYDVASVAVLSHLSSGQFATVLDAYADRALPAEDLESLETWSSSSAPPCASTRSNSPIPEA